MKLVLVSGDICGFQTWDVPSLAFLIGLKLGLDHTNDNIIAHKSTLVHDLLGFPS